MSLILYKSKVLTFLTLFEKLKEEFDLYLIIMNSTEDANINEMIIDKTPKFNFANKIDAEVKIPRDGLRRHMHVAPRPVVRERVCLVAQRRVWAMRRPRRAVARRV